MVAALLRTSLAGVAGEKKEKEWAADARGADAQTPPFAVIGSGLRLCLARVRTVSRARARRGCWMQCAMWYMCH